MKAETKTEKYKGFILNRCDSGEVEILNGEGSQLIKVHSLNYARFVASRLQIDAEKYQIELMLNCLNGKLIDLDIGNDTILNADLKNKTECTSVLKALENVKNKALQIWAETKNLNYSKLAWLVTIDCKNLIETINQFKNKL